MYTVMIFGSPGLGYAMETVSAHGPSVPRPAGQGLLHGERRSPEGPRDLNNP